MKNLISTMTLAVALNTYTSDGLAKGLDDLAEQNPETQAEGEADSKGSDAAAKAEGEAATTAATTAPVSLEGPMHQKLSFSTSFGWVYASRSEGDWRGSGMSDLTIGYRYMTLNPKLSLVGTYRYAPVSVVGEIDGNSYRGVWETHYFGSKADYKLNSKIVLTGGLEAGYVLVYLTPTDGLETEKKHEENGVSVSLGGGADFSMSENGAFTVGPRLNAGFGGFTTVQVSASAGFMF
jgi:hypothetical protein